MPAGRLKLGSVVLLAGLWLVSTADAALAAEPRSTLDRTIVRPFAPQDPGYGELVRGPAEPYLVHPATASLAQPGRRHRRRSLVYFAQLTDPQLADFMSPARVEYLDPTADLFGAAWRPQEILAAHSLDGVVRGLNRNRRSRVGVGTGRPGRLGFAVATGDLADNQQRNEVRLLERILDGGRADPFSGERVSEANPCPGATPEQVAALNEAVAARAYTGVQDYDNYPGGPGTTFPDFWDPDVPVASGRFAGFASYPGLAERALEPFRARGLAVPWFAARGNHDGLVQGNAPANQPAFRRVAIGCEKAYPGPSPLLDPRGEVTGLGPVRTLPERLELGGLTPPDPDRDFVSHLEYKRILRGADRSHGYGYIAGAERRASNGEAMHYAFSPAPGFRFLSIDVVGEGGFGDNVDDPQYRWIERTLDRSSSVELGPGGELIRDGDRDRLVVVFGHDALGTFGGTTPDEASTCTAPDDPGCDRDPRPSEPLHQGSTGPEPLSELFLRFPNVIAYVAGHIHVNQVTPYLRTDGQGGFWEIATSGTTDFPQQGRLIEVLRNRDGTLSIFATAVDSAAAVEPPAPGTAAAGMSDAELRALARTIAANDPQGDSNNSGGGIGARADRNAELLLPDPARLRKAG